MGSHRVRQDLATEQQQLSGTVLGAVDIQRANKTCFCQYSFPSAVITKYQKLLALQQSRTLWGLPRTHPSPYPLLQLLSEVPR